MPSDGLTGRDQTRHNPSRTVPDGPLMGRRLSGDRSDRPLPGNDRDPSAGSCGLPRETCSDLLHGALRAVAWLGMVASALVATMPRIGCRSQGRDRRKSEERAPHASKSDGDQRVDGHPAPTINGVPFNPPTGSVCSPTSAPMPRSLKSRPGAGVHRGSRRAPGRDVVPQRRCWACAALGHPARRAPRRAEIIFSLAWYQRQGHQTASRPPHRRPIQEVNRIGRPAITDTARTANPPEMHDPRRVRAIR